MKVIVEQRGIDVVVGLLGPDAKQIMEFDSEIRSQGQETVWQVAEVAGSYRLNVKAKHKGAPAGGYEIRVAELRAATEKTVCCRKRASFIRNLRDCLAPANTMSHAPRLSAR